jgi:hypothetical protein
VAFTRVSEALPNTLFYFNFLNLNFYFFILIYFNLYTYCMFCKQSEDLVSARAPSLWNAIFVMICHVLVYIHDLCSFVSRVETDALGCGCLTVSRRKLVG